MSAEFWSTLVDKGVISLLTVAITVTASLLIGLFTVGTSIMISLYTS
jgi:hypothetical protein